MMRITILDKASLGDDTPFDMLNKLGQVHIFDQTAEDEIEERIADSDVIIVNKIRISEGTLSRAKNLKLVCVFATGYDNIDVEAAKKFGVGVCNVPGYSTSSVTLFTVATVLALISHLYEYRTFVTSGNYTASGKPNMLTPVYHEVSGKVWGIIGCGNIGSAVARVAEALGASVIVNKRTPTNDFTCVDLDTLCRESDIITVHCPLNEQTRTLINRRTISLMKNNVILVNEARGAVLDEEAVTDAILNGRIAAFGCDVYSSEPFDSMHPYNKIMRLPNVILTPHAAWGAYEARVRCVKTIADNINAFFNSDTPLNRVD